MAPSRRSTNSDGSKVERRKSPRFAVTVPLEVSWRDPDGELRKETAVARQVNGHGGMLEMATYPEMGSRVTLANLLSAETAEARVLATPNSREGVSNGIIVELVVPGESFWGVSLQVKKTGIELQKLEKALRAEGIDPRLLKEFRETVDHVRATASVVQQLRELQLSGREEDVALSAFTADRIRRATSICTELVTDIEAGRVRQDAAGVEELYRILEQLHARLGQVVKRRETARPLASNRG